MQICDFFCLSIFACLFFVLKRIKACRKAGTKLIKFVLIIVEVHRQALIGLLAYKMLESNHIFISIFLMERA